MHFKSESWFWREEEEGPGVYLLSAGLHSTGAVLGAAALPASPDRRWHVTPRDAQPCGCCWRW